MEVGQYLAHVAHVDQRTAERAIPDTIDLGFSNTIRIVAGFRH
jgi:hypothetical protein